MLRSVVQASASNQGYPDNSSKAIEQTPTLFTHLSVYPLQVLAVPWIVRCATQSAYMATEVGFAHEEINVCGKLPGSCIAALSETTSDPGC